MLTGFCRPAFRRTFAPAPVLVVMLPKNAYSCACSVPLSIVNFRVRISYKVHIT